MENSITDSKRHIMQYIKAYLVNTFGIIEYGELHMKIGASFMLVASVSPFVWVVGMLKEHLIKDVSFMLVLLLCLFLDLVLGVWKHLKMYTFSWKRLYLGLIEKVGVSLIGMMVFNLLTDIKEWNHLESIRDYIILIGKLTNLLYVAGSAFNSMYIITGGKFPPLGWMKRMHNFNESLDTKELEDSKKVVRIKGNVFSKKR